MGKSIDKKWNYLKIYFKKISEKLEALKKLYGGFFVVKINEKTQKEKNDYWCYGGKKIYAFQNAHYFYYTQNRQNVEMMKRDKILIKRLKIFFKKLEEAEE